MQSIKERFVFSFRRVMSRCQQINRMHGFNNGDHISSPSPSEQLAHKNARRCTKLMLVVSEIVEAVDAYRIGEENQPSEHIPMFTKAEEEIADAVIRLKNFAADETLRLAEAIIAKTDFNETRPPMHGGKAF